MFKRQPSLRHFAIMRKVAWRFHGTLWEVRDRRAGGSRQLLFVPSRLLAWPVLLIRLIKGDPVPVKLRSGKVALLLEIDADSKSLLKALVKANRRPLQLDPLTGFQPAKRRLKMLWLSLLPVLFVFPTMNAAVSKNVQVKQTNNHSCSAEFPVGATVSFSELTKGVTKYNTERFKVEVSAGIGGYRILQTTRFCDGRKVSYRAWKTRAGVVVSKKI